MTTSSQNQNDPYSHYAIMWEWTSPDALQLVEDMQYMHLFDVLLSGCYDILGMPRSGKALMLHAYPCGTIFVGDNVESMKFDNEFAMKRLQPELAILCRM